jgi:transcriptional regulator with XRE-family HTH domain
MTAERIPEAGAILAARARMGLTQPQFAARLSEELARRVDRTQVAKWEAGVYQPRPHVVLAAARLVNLTLSELMAEGEHLGERRHNRRVRASAASPLNLGQPKEQVKALLELGFTLPEAIELVRAQPAPATSPGSS